MQAFSRTARATRIPLGALVAAVALAALPSSATAQPPSRLALDSLVVASTPEEESLSQGKRKRRVDTDRDGLSNWTERRRTKTNPRKADTDGDGLSDGIEVKRTKTNPRKTDSDGDGYSDGEEIVAGSDPWDPASVPGLPVPKPGKPGPQPHPDPDPSPDPEEEPDPPPPTDPVQAIWVAPTDAQVSVPVTLDGTASSGEAPLACTWSFENESGTTVFQEQDGCKIDFTFEATGTKYVRLAVHGADGDTDSNKQSFDVLSEPESEPPPDTTISSGPPATTTSTSASLSFNSNETGSSFECKLDAAAYASCSSPKAYSGLSLGEHTFAVRATDAAENTDPTPASRTWTVEEEGSPPPPPPPPPPLGCVDGATQATTAAQVRSAVQANDDVCVVANVGNVNLGGLGSRSVVVSTNGGSMGSIDLNDTTDLTIRSARFRSSELWYADGTAIEDSVIGGTSSGRTSDNLLNINASTDVTIRGNEIAWTVAGDDGFSGYGIRSPGNSLGNNDRLRIEGNYIHHIAADAIQGFGNSPNVVVDRNQIGYISKEPGSSEHSDGIQVINHGPNMQITNNWIHHEGFHAAGQATGASGTMYVHGGDNDALLIENNLFSDSMGRVEICGLGTGGTSKSNLTVRRNTFSNLGQQYNGFPGFEWDCDSGTNNLIERNVAQDPDGGFANSGSLSASSFSENLWRDSDAANALTFDAAGNCTSAACNPSGQAPIGYRKPSGVDW